MTAASRTLIQRVFLLLLLVPALWQIGTLLAVFLLRFNFPMDLEWMEGGVLVHVQRLFDGEAIYGPPGQGFLPFPYPPLHYLAIAAASLPVQLDYGIGRLVSVMFFFIACAALFHQVVQSASTKSNGVVWGILAVATIACSFPATGGWYDLIRNDSMAIALPLLAAAMLSGPGFSTAKIISAAIVLTAAVFTKQTGVFFIAWLCLFVLLQNRRSGLLLGVLIGGLSIASLLTLLLLTDGYYWLYTIEMLSGQVFSVPRMFEWARRVWLFAPYLPLLPLLAIGLAIKKWLRPRTLLWCGMLVCAIPASVLPFAKEGGYFNNLIPVVMLSGPVFILLLNDLLVGLQNRSADKLAALRWVLLSLISVYLLVYRFSPAAYVPNAAQWSAAESINRQIAGLSGGVIIPNHPFLAVRNGHGTPQFHTMAYIDAIAGKVGGLDLPGYIRDSNAEWIILANQESEQVRVTVHRMYAPVAQIPETVLMQTGYRSGPVWLMRRRDPVEKINLRAAFANSTTNWNVSGAAFAGSENALELNSANSPAGNTAIGTAESAPFVVDRKMLGFLLNGSRTARVELHHDGTAVRTVQGIDSSEFTPVVWDLSELAGQVVRLVVIDEDDRENRHAGIRQVELFDR